MSSGGLGDANDAQNLCVDTNLHDRSANGEAAELMLAQLVMAVLARRLRKLQGHRAFSFSSPNRARTLYATASIKVALIHRTDDWGHGYIAHVTRKLDAINPQVAARSAQAFSTHKVGSRTSSPDRVTDELDLSPDEFEVAKRLLK